MLDTNGTEIKNCIEDGMTVLIKKAKANNSTKDNAFRKEKFVYGSEQDIYICPVAQRMDFSRRHQKIT